MYSKKFLLSMILICFNGSGLVGGAHFSAANGVAVQNSTSSAVSSELRGLVAKGQFGAGLNSVGYREHVKRLYESTDFEPLWLKGDEPTSQAMYLVEALRGSRQKGLNPSDYGAENLGGRRRPSKGRQRRRRHRSMRL